MTTQCDYIFDDGSQCIGFAGHVSWQMDASFHVRWTPTEERWRKVIEPVGPGVARIWLVIERNGTDFYAAEFKDESVLDEILRDRS